MPVEHRQGEDSPSAPAMLAEVSDRSMSEFYQLKQALLVSTLLWTGAIFGGVWFYYGLNIALNYLLGALSGLAYLGLLARNVERLGTHKQVGKSQLAVFVGVIIISTQIDGLHVLPVFLGFLTYKVTILVYTLRTALLQK
ncbi:ATP synthase subunit I [Lyngbya confervoides]|uniref:ATP synthase subunit I n=1 Tax=Lyngbya confervoides BDU141951 TaxID=1574623 RepID=A0ABD4T5M5_9CYAN|nr:ATP synthase subunit I [Lyngbya confervoides]MCM1984081.1 ATP synthase subunit I [Lyngbya confervoides BDU141951]